MTLERPTAFYKAFQILAGAYFRLFHRVRIYGLENYIEGGAVLAANHTSYYDPPLIAVAAPEMVNFLAKESLFKVPFIGWAIRKLNAHPISGTVRDLNVFKISEDVVNSGKKLILFPEGTRSVKGRLSPLKRGVSVIVSRTQSTVIPIYIDGAFEQYSRKMRFPKPGGKLTVVFGSPIYWEEFSHLPEREAQRALVDTITVSLENLHKWLKDGGAGTPP
ncbi:MAG: 1-acyl-sn-glycerol-3-phosphate acyltransferase [Simkaniaceae bacterium]|nr:1-acyl-sn-glycerol-3-phosphate acyltransferase [Simkaniaceae bacterium]